MKNLIMGAMSGYDYADANVFLSSLEVSGYDGNVVMFVDRMRGVPPIHKFSVTWLPFQPNGLMIHDQRFQLFLNYILARPEYDNVMVADVRDVLFQSDPFKWMPLSKVVFSLEDLSDNIGSCKYNSYWIAETFGRTILSEIGPMPISCCGVTLGDRQHMVEYLRLMNAFIYPGRRGPAIGVDTAAHNFILHRGLIPCHCCPNETGPVLTTGKMKQVRYDGKFYNQDGTCPAVVHQYDRQQDIQIQVLAQYLR